MSNNKYNDHPILSWMKDLERKKLAVSLTSLLQQVSDDWSVDDSHKAIGMLEKWVYPLIDQDKLLRRNAFGDDLTFTFHVTMYTVMNSLTTFKSIILRNGTTSGILW